MKPVGRVGVAAAVVAVVATMVVCALVIARLARMPPPAGPDVEAHGAQGAPAAAAADPRAMPEAPATWPSLSSITPPPPAGEARVAIVGDSLVALSEDEVNLVVGADRELTIDARPGATIADQTWRSWELDGAPEGYDALIIELGTNDVIKPGDGVAALRRLAGQLTETPCVIFYSVVAYPDARFDEGRAINAEMIRLGQTHHRFHVSDWSTLFTSDVRFVDPRDGIHPTPAGSLAMAELFDRDLTRRCRLGPDR